MAVEQLTVNLGNTSAYDAVTAVIRGKTVPQEDQAFLIDLDGTPVNFLIETVDEKPRSSGESIWSITGRENRSEWLYRPVDFTMQMESSGSSYIMPRAAAILAAAGIQAVYHATNFRPTAGGMGWKVTVASGSATVRIREKNFQTLLNKLFSWTSEFGPRKINWHVRAGVCYVWDQNQVFGSTLAITNDIVARDSLNISSKKLRTYTEPTDSSGNGVSTPHDSYSFAWNYEDVPISGTSSGPGGSVCSYSDGLLDLSVRTTESGSVTETYGYSTYWGAKCLTWKETVDVDNSGDETVTRITQTVSHYSREQEGKSVITGRDVPVLSWEETVSWTVGVVGREVTTVYYSSNGNGFYSISAIKDVYGEDDDGGEVLLDRKSQHSTSRSAPGGAASQAMEKRCTGYTWTYTPSAPATGYTTLTTSLPIEYTEALEYLSIAESLNGVKELRISAELVGQTAYNPVGGAITYRGKTYYATESRITRTSTGKRMTVEGVRWE